MLLTGRGLLAFFLLFLHIAGKIGANLLPALAAIGGFQHHLHSEIKNRRILRREDKRRHACPAILLAALKHGSDFRRRLVIAHH